MSALAAPSFFSERDLAAFVPSFDDGNPYENLPSAMAYEVFIVAGWNAIIGWPLPNGYYPVAGPNMGAVQMHPYEVETYRTLCYAESIGAVIGRH